MAPPRGIECRVTTIGRRVFQLSDKTYDDIDNTPEKFKSQLKQELDRTPLILNNIPDITIIQDNNIKTIHDSAFCNESKLTYATFSQLTSTSVTSFCRCSQLVQFSANQLQQAGIASFSECKQLRKVDFPQLAEIPIDMFRECINLQQAHLDNAEVILNFAFRDCEQLRELYLPLCGVFMNGCFVNCKKLNESSQDIVLYKNPRSVDYYIGNEYMLKRLAPTIYKEQQQMLANQQHLQQKIASYDTLYDRVQQYNKNNNNTWWPSKNQNIDLTDLSRP